MHSSITYLGRLRVGTTTTVGLVPYFSRVAGAGHLSGKTLGLFRLRAVTPRQCALESHCLTSLLANHAASLERCCPHSRLWYRQQDSARWLAEEARQDAQQNEQRMRRCVGRGCTRLSAREGLGSDQCLLAAACGLLYEAVAVL